MQQKHSKKRLIYLIFLTVAVLAGGYLVYSGATRFVITRKIQDERNQVAAAVEAYFHEKGEYPPDLKSLGPKFSKPKLELDFEYTKYADAAAKQKDTFDWTDFPCHNTLPVRLYYIRSIATAGGGAETYILTEYDFVEKVWRDSEAFDE